METQIWLGTMPPFCSIELLLDDEDRYVFRYKEDVESVELLLADSQIESLHKALTERFG